MRSKVYSEGPALPILDTDGIRRREREAAGLPLMELAGRSTAELANELAKHGPILALAGPGNNGGDAFVAARYLRAAGRDVEVCFLGREERLSTDATTALARWREGGGQVLDRLPPLGRQALILDGLFGIGLERPLEGGYAEAVAALNVYGLPVLAIDIPSGLHAESGKVLGMAARAAATISFIGLKAGLLTGDGVDHCGDLWLDTLGLPEGESEGRLLTAASVAPYLHPRQGNSHKGSFGSIGILGGGAGMVGAMLLAGRAALKLGAGRVYSLGLDGAVADPIQPEVMAHPATALPRLPLTTLACGCGLGQSPAAHTAVADCLGFAGPLLLDADALNLLAQDNELKNRLRARTAPTVLTPHPLEAARMLRTDTAEIGRDRVAAACGLAQEMSAVVVLKGAGSIVAEADGRYHINSSGNPGLATAGSGDVLAGIVGALLAQGLPPAEAAKAGVWLHGAAADDLAGEGIGPVGLTAGEIADAARRRLNQLAAKNRPHACRTGPHRTNST